MKVEVIKAAVGLYLFIIALSIMFSFGTILILPIGLCAENESYIPMLLYTPYIAAWLILRYSKYAR